MWLLLGLMALQGVATYMQGRAQARQLAYEEMQAKHNAKIAEMDAAAARKKATFEQLQQRRESEMIMGRIRAEQGAAGARTDVGAPLAVRSQKWAELDLENFLIGLEGRTQAAKYQSQAAMFRTQAKYYGKGAKRAILTGLLGAGAAVGQGYMAGTSAGYWGQSSTTYNFGSSTATRGAGRF